MWLVGSWELIVNRSLNVWIIQSQDASEHLPDAILSKVVESLVQIPNLTKHGLLSINSRKRTRLT
jgi:hypothetical protein